MKTFLTILGVFFGTLLVLTIWGLQIFGIPYVVSLLFDVDFLLVLSAWALTLYIIEKFKVIKLRHKLKVITEVKNLFSEFGKEI